MAGEGDDPKRAAHYFPTKPFQSVTGRNQPSRWTFGSPKWMRWLVKPAAPDHVLVTADYLAQAIGGGAA